MVETRGLECDKMDREAVKAMFDGAMGKIAEKAGKLCGNGWNMVLMDSWEAGCLNWSEHFREEFTKRRGYNPSKYMPTLTGRYVDTPEKTERFLWDYRRTIADLIADNHYGYIHDLLHEHNIGLTAEAPGIGMPVVADELQCKGKTDVPMERVLGWLGRAIAECSATARNVLRRRTFTARESRPPNRSPQRRTTQIGRMIRPR